MIDTHLVYPYEFEGGKKAIASEVNANFEAVKNFAYGINVNLNELQEALNTIKNKPTREMFDIFYSFSRKTPDGAYPLWTGETITHCKSLYPQFWKEVNKLSTQGNLETVTLEEYEKRLEKYGQCAAFYVDSLNGHIRLPKITQFISSISDLTELSKEQEAGIPNIKGTILKSCTYTKTPEATGVFKLSNTSAASTSSMGKTTHSTVTFDASTCNSVYGKSQTVQPASVKLCLYIQVANNMGQLSELDFNSVAKELEDALDSLNAAYKDYAQKLDKKYQEIIDDFEFSSGLVKEINILVIPDMFTLDNSYSDYPYVAILEIPKASATMVPTVNFDLEQANSGIFAPIAIADDGIVRIYAKEISKAKFTIPSIILQ